MGRQLPQPDSGLTPAEQHLGDRLAALIDGELGHDARERVLAHLATCRGCKTEADAQRRVKNVFADTAPPPPSDGLLARLQGLPAGGPDARHDRTATESADGPRGGSAGGFSRLPTAAVSAESGFPWALDQLPGGRGGSALSPSRGFRVHERERQPARSRRFAFAAAGAVSLAALALGGALGTSTNGSSPTVARGDTGGASASSVRTTSAAATADRDRRRRDAGVGARSSRVGTVNASASAAAVAGASVATDRNAVFQHGAPWTMPSAPQAAAKQPGAVYPLLRDALFAPPLIRSALPQVAYGSYQPDAYTGTPVDAVPGRTPVRGAPAPAPVATAAPPQG